MPLMLKCDCPGCPREMPARLVRGQITGPQGWWVQPGGNGLLIACPAANHINLAITSEAAQRQADPDE